MTEEATTKVETEASQRGVSRRDQEMERIIADREAEAAKLRESEKAPKESEVPDTKEQEKTTDKQEEITDEAIEQPEMIKLVGQDGTEYLVPKDAKAKFKIDGEEVEDTIDASFRRYQKGAAGDKRMQEAAEVRKSLEAREQALTQREAVILQQLQHAERQNKAGNLSNDDYTTKVKSLTDALLEADEDKLEAVIRDLIPGQGVLTEDVIDKKLRERELAKAQRRFLKEYPEFTLKENPALYHRVNAKTGELYAQRPDDDFWEIIKDAAESVREESRTIEDERFVARLKESGMSDTEINIILSGKKPETKKQVKKTPALPTVSARATIGEDVKPHTRAEVLAEMRQARGQPPL